MKKLMEEIQNNLDKDNKLPCVKALQILKKYSKQDFINAILELNIKISDCELGQFGSLEKTFAKSEIFEILEPLLDQKNRIECKYALEKTKNFDMKEVRATLKDYKIDIKYCELGCFKEKKGKKFNVKSKIWIENPDGKLLFGKGKTDILELIGEHGSIAKAAKILGISYKKAWLYIQDLQVNMKEELIVAKKGRGEESGSKLTPRAYELIKNYKILQQDVEEFTNKRFKELFFKKNEKNK
ncbi:winged helix-turn-helix domain-containing protein [Campylobacter volucris]|uniref:winged helix-turn-helix domain-containing protein n=1 Tax=Campylobacter volucris TaxID=1031542 RepID=UPI00189D5039|nr:winged helix-turn-helix domain-containing protein [Campylobacter volucris]MBF7048110.1 winged helix-turn-helix domain-containing protein [Campylobacter volucris]